jgi:hypothetical protein
MPEHLRPAVAHNFCYLRPHGIAVAVHGAELAEPSAFDNGATSEAFGCVLGKLLASGAYGRGASLVLFALAVQAYHQRDDFLLPRLAPAHTRRLMRRTCPVSFARFVHEHDYTRSVVLQ